MSIASQFIKNHSRREELIEKAKAGSFFGVPIKDLSKDDLLLMIGLLGTGIRDRLDFQTELPRKPHSSGPSPYNAESGN